MGRSEGELSLTLVGDRAMARLNRETFGRRGPTNVIAFPVDSPAAVERTPLSSEPPGPAPVWGEVVISVETTVRQAEDLGWRGPELLDFFLIHGILHLLGYDHLDPEAEERMTGKTWELIRILYPRSRWVQEFQVQGSKFKVRT